jgi:eukaryotic-like serine/threonine-protein kinase
MIGETIGNYKIVSLLGTGGMGEVFLAENAAIETRVAIKVLQPGISRDQDHVQRFFNEARAVSKVNHAGTVKIFDSGVFRDRAYLVMEFLDGETLGKRIARLNRMHGAQVSEIARQIAGVLEAVHAAGITHRDLKPDNVYLISDPEMPAGERVKILDFGIAKLTGTLGGASPRTVGTMGTPAYMAPEQWNNSSDVDGRADTYSLACVAFEMLCGWPPFPAGSIGEACTHHLHTPPPHLRSVIPAMPEQLDALLDRMLAKSADGRPPIREVAQTFAELRNARFPDVTGTVPISPTAKTVSTGVPIYKAPTVTSGEVAPTRPRTGVWVAGIGAALVIGTVVAVLAIPRGESGGNGGANGGVGSQDAVDAAHLGTADVLSAPVDTPPTASTRDQIVARNPFVDIAGVRILSHQVTNAEYAIVVGKRGNAVPEHPVTTITRSMSAVFCTSIGARLPTSDEWERASQGRWGILINGVTGPLQEWTATDSDGLAVVRGGYAAMTTQALVKAGTSTPPYYLQKEDGNADDLRTRPSQVSSPTIGFRCVDPGPSGRTD